MSVTINQDPIELAVINDGTTINLTFVTGLPGADGTDGVGIPAGGTTNQILAKASSADFDVHWINHTGGGGGGGGVTDHGALTGLLDDDHPQYLTEGRGDLRYPTISATNAALNALALEIDGKADLAHTHAINDVTGLQTALDGKQPVATVLTNTTASFTTAQEAKLAGIAAGATANSADATLLARGNHTGTQAIGTVTGLQTALDGKQPLATVLTNTTASFTTAQESKLAGIAAGATANSADATLLSRTNHTGTQAISTVTGLQTALDGKLGVSGEAASVATINGRIQAGSNVTFDGAGTAASPFVVNAVVPPSAGDVVGPAGATNNALVRYDTGTGKLVQNSNVLVSDAGELTLPYVASPAIAAADTVNLFGRKISGRMLPAFNGPNNIDSSLQPFFARNHIGLFRPTGNSTTVHVVGIAPATATGFTATSRNVTFTNFYTRMLRIGYVSTATVASVGQFRSTAAQFTVGNSSTGLGGFFQIIRFGISDAAAVAGARMFIGIRESSQAPSNVEPNTLTNCIGVGHGESDTNMHLFYGGTTAQPAVNLGLNFPTNTRSTDAYELALFSAPTSPDVHWQLTRLNTGDVTGGTIVNSGATVLPTNTIGMNYWGYRTNNNTALAVGLDIMNLYQEKDN